ncbi:MAG: hypothetical protein R3E32_27270 [Chitinophagales bacterium]
MQNKLLTILTLITFFASCTPTNNINTVEFQNIEYQVVAKGNDSGIKNKLLIVAYNKYFNESQFDSDFISSHNLNTVDFRENMLVEIFLGTDAATKGKITLTKIEENKDLIKVHYETKEGDEPSATAEEEITPFLIVSVPKSRKTTKFFENGEEVKIAGGNLYIKN